MGRDEDEAIIAAAALAEKHHAEKNGGTRDASAREEAAPSLNGFGDGDDDDEDLLAAAAAAVVDRAQRGRLARQPPNASSANGTMGSTREAVQSTENGSHAAADVEVKKKVAKDEAEADLVRELRLIEEETRAESKFLAPGSSRRWIRRIGKILSVSLKKPNGNTKKMVLKDEWGESPFEVGDGIALYGLNEDAKRRLERRRRYYFSRRDISHSLSVVLGQRDHRWDEFQVFASDSHQSTGAAHVGRRQRGCDCRHHHARTRRKGSLIRRRQKPRADGGVRRALDQIHDERDIRDRLHGETAQETDR